MSGRQPTEVERQHARLRELLPGWDLWAIHIQFTNSRDWSARPDGASSAAVTAHSPDDLVEAVKAWDVNEYISTLDADLAGTPDHWKTKREMLAANLLAARRLRAGQWQAGAAKP